MGKVFVANVVSCAVELHLPSPLRNVLHINVASKVHQTRHRNVQAFRENRLLQRNGGVPAFAGLLPDAYQPRSRALKKQAVARELVLWHQLNQIAGC